MAVMVKILTEKNKTMIEMMKTQSDKNEIPGPSNFVKRPAEIQQQISKIKWTKFNGSYFARLGHPQGQQAQGGTCTESDNVNVFRVINPTTNVEENNNDSDDQENDNISCLENKIIENNSSDVDSIKKLFDSFFYYYFF